MDDRASQQGPPVGDDRGALRVGAALFDAGRHHEAHEVFEEAWRRAKRDDPVSAPFWQGLVLLAGALHHASRGNAQGRAALLERAASRLDGAARSGGPHAARATSVLTAVRELRASGAGRSRLATRLGVEEE